MRRPPEKSSQMLSSNIITQKSQSTKTLKKNLYDARGKQGLPCHCHDHCSKTSAMKAFCIKERFRKPERAAQCQTGCESAPVLGGRGGRGRGRSCRLRLLLFPFPGHQPEHPETFIRFLQGVKACAWSCALAGVCGLVAGSIRQAGLNAGSFGRAWSGPHYPLFLSL